MARLLIFQAAVFLSAFLLFQIQPIMAKSLLPIFGGSYLVWGACMAFFQGVLLLGYGYTHWVQRRFGVVRYSRLHLIPLLLPLLLIPVRFEWLAHVDYERSMFLQVLLLLAITVGLPFFTLSTGSVLLQSWLAHSNHPQRDNPYVLYSASNAGSILALLSYPVLFEPTMTLHVQARLWAVLYMAMLALVLLCLPPRRRTAGNQAREDTPPAARTPRGEAFVWVLLSASGSALLLAVTNILTFDVASVPFLWSIPLSVYLLTFVLLFKRTSWCPDWIRQSFVYVLVAGVALHLMMTLRWELPVVASILLYCGLLFLLCMRCHGLLAARRPADVRELTRFYLALSFGGFLGSLFVGGLLPIASSNLVEFPLALMLAAVALALATRDVDGAEELPPANEPLRTRLRAAVGGWRRPVLLLLVVGLTMTALPTLGKLAGLGERLLLAPLLLPLAFVLLATRARPLWSALVIAAIVPLSGVSEEILDGSTNMIRHRNYYGIYKIYDRDGMRFMQHGTTLHGRQYLDSERAHVPLSYYHPSAPASELLNSKKLSFQKVGMIGLGPGALAVSLRPPARFDIFELDRDNFLLAEQHFTYLDQARRNGIELAYHAGDGRLALARHDDAAFDLLVIDAFSSGAIPAHLLTVEAIEQYLRSVGPRGLVLFHISNKFVDLEPLLYSLARAVQTPMLVKTNHGAVEIDADPTIWVVLTRDEPTLFTLRRDLHWRRPVPAPDTLPRPWTDQYSNVLGLFLQRHDDTE
ncbi:MAG: hypothetical protein KF858_02405 [Candidatus Sumerlaeia bacterium]|nr:hypothetical protein [Candidatus Sumerlaeia bacterium]